MDIRSTLFGLLALVLTVGLVGCDSGGSGNGDMDEGPTPTLNFTESESTVGEGDGTYTVDVSVENPGDQEVSGSVSFNASSSSATRGTDFEISMDSTIQFPQSASSGDTQPFEIDVIDDDSVEEEETAVFDLEESEDVGVGETSTFTLTITDNDEPSPTYEVLADSSALAPSSGNTDAHCIVHLSTGELVFFNSSEGGIFSYDSGLNVERSASDLNSDISATSNTIDRCGGVVKDDNDNTYFLFRSSQSSDENSTIYVYKLPASGEPTVLASGKGFESVAHHDGTVYLAGVAFTGAQEDGFYSVSDTGADQSVTQVATEAALDLGYGMDVDSDGNVYAFSGGFADGDRARKIVRLADPSGSATIEEFVDPYRDGSPLIADSGSDIGDIDIASRNGDEVIVVYNGSFEASDGDQWASIQISDQSINLLFNRTTLVDNLSVSGFTSGFTEPNAVNADGELFVTSRGAFGAEYYIAKASNVLP